MPGQMGNESITTKHLMVYRIDYKRNLLYVKGSVAGNPHELMTIFDSKNKRMTQFDKLIYPTFIGEPGKTYPDIMEFADTKDMNEWYTHDNDEVLGVSDEEEEGEPEAGEEGEDMDVSGGAAAPAKK